MQDLTEERYSPPREHEAFRVMFEQAGFGVGQVSLNGEWLAVNQALCDILGYSRSELLNEPISLVTRFDDFKAEQAECLKLLNGDIQSFSSQKRHLRHDGRVVWLKGTITLVRDHPTGAPDCFLAIVEDCTPQKRAIQRALFESDKSFRVLTDSISDLFFTLDLDLRCSHWNRAAEQLTGIPAADVIGRRIADAFPSEQGARALDSMLREVLETRRARSFSFACRITNKEFLFEGTAYPSKNGLSVVARDVASHKRAEEALRNSEAKFAKAFEGSPAMITIARIEDRRYVEVNRAFEQHTGFSRSELLGRSVSEVALRLDLQSLDHAFAEAVTYGSVRNMEALIRQKTGQRLFVLLSADLIEFDGKPCVLTVAEDITERKQADDALRESEERFRIMADSAPIMMWMAGPDKGCTDFNRGWLAFTGRAITEERGDGWAAGVHPADLQDCISKYHAAFDQRRPFTLQYRLRRHDGEYRWITDTGVPRFLPDGSFVGYIGCCIDVEDQKQAELARTELSRRLMTAQEAERRRIARELHDGIGQALALLGIQLQRAGQPSSLGKKHPGVKELCSRVKEIGEQVSRLSHQLHSSELEYLGLVVAVKGLCREFAQQFRVKIECTCQGVPEELDNDVALCLLRMVQESLHNIAKHSRATSVHVELAGTDGELVLTVTDNGVGFDAGTASKAKGLGLVSMRERMHLIGGKFSITSKLGDGSRIQARAPLTTPR
jgi:PAS domain S-box-containing protein